MARLFLPSYGVVQQLCNQFVSQCSCLNALQHLAQSQPTPWAASSSSVQQQRHKSTVRMVLLKDHEHLGSRGDIVEVKAGYARHDLFPKGEADYAVPSVIRQLKVRAVWTAGLTGRSAGRMARPCCSCQTAMFRDRAASQQDCAHRAALHPSHSFLPVCSSPCFGTPCACAGARAVECSGTGAAAAWCQEAGCTWPSRPLHPAPGAAAAADHQTAQQKTTGAPNNSSRSSLLTAAVLGERRQTVRYASSADGSMRTAGPHPPLRPQATPDHLLSSPALLLLSAALHKHTHTHTSHAGRVAALQSEAA